MVNASKRKRTRKSYCKERYEVEKVDGFKLDENSELRFMTKWKGYDEEHNTWEPMENLVHNLGFLEYVNQKFICE